MKYGRVQFIGNNKIYYTYEGMRPCDRWRLTQCSTNETQRAMNYSGSRGELARAN